MTADKASFHRSLSELRKQAKIARNNGSITELVFIYIGHGNIDPGGLSYLSLIDGRLTRENLFDDIFSQTEFDLVHVIIDACHALYMVAGRGETPQKTSEREFQQMLLAGALQAYPHVGVFLASAANEEAFEWSRIQGGVFSYVLRSALLGASDINGDGEIHYAEAHAFVLSALQGIDDANLRQTVFARPPKKAPQATLSRFHHLAAQQLLPIKTPGKLTLYDKGTLIAATHRLSPYILTLYGAGPYYAKIANHEYKILQYHEKVERLIDNVEPSPLARGRLDDDLQRGIFKIPFDASCFRAFALLSDYPIPPVFAEQTYSPSSKLSLQWHVATLLGNRLLEGQGTTFGILLQGHYNVTETLAFIFGLSAETHRSKNLPQQPITKHLGVPMGLQWRLPLNAHLHVQTQAQLGYSAMFARNSARETASLTSVEYLGMHGRAAILMAVVLSKYLEMAIGPDFRLLSARYSDNRIWRAGYGVQAGVTFNLP